MDDSPEGTHAYAYDDVYRLTAADHPGAMENRMPDESYSYDAVGNRLSSLGARVMLGALRKAEYEYDDGYRLATDSVYVYKYDRRGNMISRVRSADGLRWEYDYDAEDRLAEARRFPGFASGGEFFATGAPDVVAVYAYDLLGRRVSKTVNGAARKYVYTGWNVAMELDGRDRVVARYYHLPGALDHPVAMVRGMDENGQGGQTFYYHYDERGSVVALTNEAGEVVQRYEYDSFGNMTLVEGGIANPYTYTGREWDAETGLYYYRFRHYDPETGRFLQTDPVFDLDAYSYAGNNPVNYTDPFGLKTAGGVGGGGKTKDIKVFRYFYPKVFCDNSGCFMVEI
ncbi:MAG: RHS repeat-associated core domain-containing protein, partial [bacterium]